MKEVQRINLDYIKTLNGKWSRLQGEVHSAPPKEMIGIIDRMVEIRKIQTRVIAEGKRR